MQVAIETLLLVVVSILQELRCKSDYLLKYFSVQSNIYADEILTGSEARVCMLNNQI